MHKIKILLYDLKLSNKEYQEIITNINLYSIPDLFNAIFSIKNYTNTDMYNFLTVYDLYNLKEENILGKIVNLKFFQGEKDTDQVILKYFQVLTSTYCISISQPLFERFIILLNSPLFSSAIIYEIFKYLQIFLIHYPGFLKRSIYNLKDNSMKYKLLYNTKDISYVFIVPDIKLILLDNTKSKYLLQEYFNNIPRWYINNLNDNILSYLYYNFDGLEIYKDLCYEFFTKLSLSEIINEFKKNKLHENLKSEMEKMVYNQSIIETFNKSKNIEELYNKYKDTTFLILRYHHLTDLKILGEFLCNHKNVTFLKEFTDTFDFTNMDILVSLRYFLSGFYLVGESQIIYRVLEVFSNHYVKFNKFDPEFILNLCFSLLLLNTKMYNSNIKSKPTFEEYISDFDKEEIPENINMLELYNSIKNDKINLPEKIESSLAHYEVYTKMIKRIQHFKINIQNIDIYDVNNLYQCLDTLQSPCNLSFSIPCYLMDKSLADSNSILNSPHDKFYELCKYSSIKYIPLYLKYNKSDPYRFLNMFKYYLSYDGDIEIYRIFLNLKTKKYDKLYAEITNTKLSGTNCKILVDLYKEKPTNILLLMLERNLNELKSINFMDFESQVNLMSRSTDLQLIKNSQYAIKLLRNVLIANPKLISKEFIELFKEIDDGGDDAFYTMILLQKEEDMFNYVIKVNVEHDDINLSIDNVVDSSENTSINDVNKLEENIDRIKINLMTNYKISEKYKMDDSIKLFQFYSTSKYILNQTVLKRCVTKEKCLRENDISISENLDNRLIYMIYKSNEMNNKELTTYTLWIINLLSTSLPVVVDFFDKNINLLKNNLQESIIKIIISRLKKVVSGLPLCCGCKYNNIGKTDTFISKLIDNDIVKIEDLEFWFVWKKEMNKNKRIIEINGEYLLL